MIGPQRQPGVKRRACRQQGQLPQIAGSGGIVEPRQPRHMNRCLTQHDSHRGGDHSLEKRRAHLVAVTIKAGQKNRVEHRIQEERRRKQRRIGIQSHLIASQRIDPRAEHRTGSSHRQRSQFNDHAEQHRRLHVVPLADRQQRREVRVPLLAALHEAEKQAQHNIEKRHGIGIAGNQQHGAEQNEHQRHGVAHQPELLI